MKAHFQFLFTRRQALICWYSNGKCGNTIKKVWLQDYSIAYEIFNESEVPGTVGLCISISSNTDTRAAVTLQHVHVWS